MKSKLHQKPKIGLISVTDAPREQGLVQEREEYINKAHGELLAYLQQNGVDAFDVSQSIERANPGWVSISSYAEASRCVKAMINEDVEALVLGCWHWCEPMLVVALAREFNKPVLLYSDGNPAWAGVTLISAAGASLWQNAPNSCAVAHKRVYVEKEEILSWIKGVSAVEKLKKGTLILWGGSYALKMEYLQDDYSKLKSFLVGDIINEDQYMLIKQSEKISTKRLDDFVDWLVKNNASIAYDEKIMTREIFRKQVALYLASKDIMEQYENIAGVSVKCFTELSDVFGADACLMPSFLPFPEDAEGKKEVVSCVCEGDIKALICSSLLTSISSGVPSLFGDILYMGKDYLVMGNCGGSSVYYSCCSCNVRETLGGLTIAQNFEGRGGAVSYNTPGGKLMTMVRLLKIKGEYILLQGLMKTVEITPQIRSKTSFFRNWPLTALQFNVDRSLLIDSLGANHLIGVPGDFTKEMSYACNSAGIRMFRMDNEIEIKEWIKYSLSKATGF